MPQCSTAWCSRGVGLTGSGCEGHRGSHGATPPSVRWMMKRSRSRSALEGLGWCHSGAGWGRGVRHCPAPLSLWFAEGGGQDVQQLPGDVHCGLQSVPGGPAPCPGHPAGRQVYSCHSQLILSVVRGQRDRAGVVLTCCRTGSCTAPETVSTGTCLHPLCSRLALCWSLIGCSRHATARRLEMT